jgi:tRNA threonylcarbamoyladenosine biosynthesis protein TsaB
MAESWLILETSGRVAKVGLARGVEIVRSVQLDEMRRHARDLAATVAALMSAEALSPADLTGIIAGRGPGSYTGLRVGLMSAKALAYATGCKLVAVDTFAAIAQQAPAEAESVWVIADALKHHVYVQGFARGAGVWHATDALRIVPIDEWLPTAPAKWVSGPGVAVYADRLPMECRVVAEVDREPRVESVFAIGKRLAPLSREEMFALEPLYLRASSAEEKVNREPGVRSQESGAGGRESRPDS